MSNRDERYLELRTRLEGKGFLVSERNYVCDHGLTIFPDEPRQWPPMPATAVVSVHLEERGYTLRVCRHGGLHWIAEELSESDAVELISTHITTPTFPPKGNFSVVPEWKGISRDHLGRSEFSEE